MAHSDCSIVFHQCGLQRKKKFKREREKKTLVIDNMLPIPVHEISLNRKTKCTHASGRWWGKSNATNFDIQCSALPAERWETMLAIG